MKDIIIVANFIGALDGGRNSRFTYLADKLSRIENLSVEVVSSSFSHDYKKQRDNIKINSNYKVTLIDEPGYKRNVCIQRFFSHYIWGKNVISYLKSRKKPDLIYCAVPSLTGPNKIGRYCEENRIPFIIDIQDLWPEAFQMVFNVPVISSIIFAPFKIIANGVYKEADEIIAVSQTYVDRAMSVNRKCTEGHTVFLGTELGDFDRNVRENPVTKKTSDEIWMGYCGTLGASYDLTTVFDAMRIIQVKGLKTPKFIVMGNGPKEDEFKEKAKGLNVEFMGLLPYSRMCGLLAACDFVINPIMHNAAQSIINKHADYAAVGLPVINTQECKEYKELVEENNMGFNVPNADAECMAEKIIELCNNQELREVQGKNSRFCAELKFDRSRTYDEIISLILTKSGKNND